MNIKKLSSSIFLAALLAAACSAKEIPATVPEISQSNTIPEEVRQFQEERDVCDHFRGEEGYDEERQKFLDGQLKKYCTGTDQKLKELKLKYNNAQDIYKLLQQYDESIE